MIRRLAIVTVVMTLTLTACWSAKKPVTLPVADPVPVRNYVAIGASESVGIGADAPLRDSWTKVFWTNGLPKGTVFSNVAVAGSDASDAVTTQLPKALALQPDYVTVWLNVNDIIDGVTPAAYERSLNQILSDLHSKTQAKVLVANTPPLDQMPAFLDAMQGNVARNSPFFGQRVPTVTQLNTAVDAYNAVIAQAIATYNDTLVDLHAIGLAARTNGTATSLYGADGFHPSTTGHAAIGQAFVTAFQSAASKS